MRKVICKREKLSNCYFHLLTHQVQLKVEGKAEIQRVAIQITPQSGPGEEGNADFLSQVRYFDFWKLLSEL